MPNSIFLFGFDCKIKGWGNNTLADLRNLHRGRALKPASKYATPYHIAVFVFNWTEVNTSHLQGASKYIHQPEKK